MKTDSLFYELFRIEPRSLFELAGLDIEGEYAFESITVKTTEKRFDGFFVRKDGMGPNVFLEIQGYDDPAIYWRSFREVSTWYEQTKSDVSFILIILFTDKKYKPEKCPLKCDAPNMMLLVTLEEALKSVGERAGFLTVLKPFSLSGKEKLPEAAVRWKKEIDSLYLPEYKTEKLTELLEYVILQCFPKLSLKEIKNMIQLTPLEKTAAGQELIQIGVKQGVKITALNMLKMGLDIKVVSMATGLTEKEIKQLSLSLKKQAEKK